MRHIFKYISWATTLLFVILPYALWIMFRYPKKSAHLFMIPFRKVDAKVEAFIDKYLS